MSFKVPDVGLGLGLSIDRSGRFFPTHKNVYEKLEATVLGRGGKPFHYPWCLRCGRNR